MTEGYGFEAGNETPLIKKEIALFKKWSTNPFQFDRGERYTGRVASETMDKQQGKIRAFLGYVASFKNEPVEQVGLDCYSVPKYLTDFMAYLLARGVGKGHLLGHLSVARKVNDFLKSQKPDDEAAAQFYKKMDGWLGRIEAQVQVVMPKPKKSYIPECAVLMAWAQDRCETAALLVERRITGIGFLDKPTAMAVQDAIVIALVVGLWFPPIRINMIKTWNLPRNGKAFCDDRDCLNKERCQGNRLILTVAGQDLLEQDLSEPPETAVSEDLSEPPETAVSEDLSEPPETAVSEDLSEPPETAVSQSAAAAADSSGAGEGDDEAASETAADSERGIPSDLLGLGCYDSEGEDEQRAQPEEDLVQEPARANQGHASDFDDDGADAVDEEHGGPNHSQPQPSGGSHISIDQSSEDSQNDEGMTAEQAWKERFAYGKVQIRSVIVHGKTENRAGGIDMDFLLPQGLATKLLTAHIIEGRPLLAHIKESEEQRRSFGEDRLFVSAGGNAFNSTTFAHYWRKLMNNCSIAKERQILYFAPSEARTSFVEEYTSENGVAPVMHDGAADVMGNTCLQWKKSYNPSGRKRKVQATVNGHGVWVEGRVRDANQRHEQDKRGGGGGGGGKGARRA
jgi:hypothetical protein